MGLVYVNTHVRIVGSTNQKRRTKELPRAFNVCLSRQPAYINYIAPAGLQLASGENKGLNIGVISKKYRIYMGKRVKL